MTNIIKMTDDIKRATITHLATIYRSNSPELAVKVLETAHDRFIESGLNDAAAVAACMDLHSASMNYKLIQLTGV